MPATWSSGEVKVAPVEAAAALQRNPELLPYLDVEGELFVLGRPDRRFELDEESLVQLATFETPRPTDEVFGAADPEDAELLRQWLDHGLLVGLGEGEPPREPSDFARAYAAPGDRRAAFRDAVLGYRAPCLEAMQAGGRTVHDRLCAEGRQLAEGHACVPELGLDLPTDYRDVVDPVRYEGAKRINESAFRQVAHHWHEALATISFVRDQLLPLRPHTGPMTLADLSLLTSALGAIPSYLMRRECRPLADGELPGPLAVVFKLVIGVQGALLMMIDSPEHTSRSVVTPEEALHFCEANGLFVAADMACAGPAPMIIEMLAALTGDLSPDAKPASVVAEADDLPSLLAYVLCSAAVDAALDLFGWGARIVAGRALDRLRALDNADAPALAAALAWDGTRGMAVVETPAQRARLAAIMAEFADHSAQLGGRPTFAFREAFCRDDDGDDVSDAERADLAAMLAARPPADGRSLASARVIADELLSYIAFERRAGRLIAAIQAEVRRNLGRPASPISQLAFADLATAVAHEGPTFRDAVEKHFHVVVSPRFA